MSGPTSLSPEPLSRDVRARARVVRRTLDALTDDTQADVMGVIALAASWDGAVTPLELAAAARKVEGLLATLDGEERMALHAVRSTLALARLAMRSETSVTDSLLVAPLEAAACALVEAGWDSPEADWQVYVWLAEALLHESEPAGNDAPSP